MNSKDLGRLSTAGMPAGASRIALSIKSWRMWKSPLSIRLIVVKLATASL